MRDLHYHPKMCCTTTPVLIALNWSILHYHPKMCCTTTKEVVTMESMYPSLPSENVLYYNLLLTQIVAFPPSLPSENVLYYNFLLKELPNVLPSLPSENVLYYNLKWHYRLLRDFNLATNDEGMISIHLYFRYFYQGP